MASGVLARGDLVAGIGNMGNKTMSDTELLDWLEHTGAQSWQGKDGRWTVWLKHPQGDYCIQPTAALLREGIQKAKELYDKANESINSM